VSFTAEVSTPDPRPGARGGTVGMQNITLTYDVIGAGIRLDTGSQSGDFACEVQVLAVELDPGVLRSVIPTVRATEQLSFRCVRYQMEEAYEEAFRRCFDFGTRFEEVPDFRVVIDPGDPAPYAVRPELLEEVLRYEILAAAERDEHRDEVISYAAARFLIPEDQLRARVEGRR
jgi:hypothetical protein